MTHMHKNKPQKQGQRNDRPLSSRSRRRSSEPYWTFYKKSLYVTKPASKRPAWLFPLLVTLLVIALVFWVAPKWIRRWEAGRDPLDPAQTAVQDQLYGPDVLVVTQPVAEVFDQPDLKAKRLAQVLYLEAVRRRPVHAEPGFVAVALDEGIAGYMLAEDLLADATAIEPARYPYRALVLAPTKRIFSHAEKGTLLLEVMMGTELFVDYRGAGVCRVQLATGDTGWISEDGVMVLPAQEAVAPPADPALAFCDTALLFLQATALEQGLSIRGISMEGVVYLSARVNGLELPRSLEGLCTAGLPVAVIRDEQTGQPVSHHWKPGDLLFFSADGSQPDRLGILIQPDQLLAIRPGQSSVRLLDVQKEEQLVDQLFCMRRLFP